jgi:hypothetical protein
MEMIDIYTSDTQIHELEWHEIPVTLKLQHTRTNPSEREMCDWCLCHQSTGLFRKHFTLKYPYFQGSFWFENIEDAIEFRLRWL